MQSKAFVAAYNARHGPGRRRCSVLPDMQHNAEALAYASPATCRGIPAMRLPREQVRERVEAYGI
jgi:hypothetical protein